MLWEICYLSNSSMEVKQIVVIPPRHSQTTGALHNIKHWLNEESMLLYISDIIVPFVTRTREEMGVGKEQQALAIFDHFNGQLTEKISQALDDENIHSVIVPGGCTDQLQPLDLTVNRVAKSFLQERFREWYAEKIANQFCDEEAVVLTTAQMKSISARWLIELYEHFHDNPLHAVNGFLSDDKLQSINAGKPIITTKSKDDEIDDDDDDSEEMDEDDSEEEIENV